MPTFQFESGAKGMTQQGIEKRLQVALEGEPLLNDALFRVNFSKDGTTTEPEIHMRANGDSVIRLTVPLPNMFVPGRPGEYYMYVVELRLIGGKTDLQNATLLIHSCITLRPERPVASQQLGQTSVPAQAEVGSPEATAGVVEKKEPVGTTTSSLGSPADITTAKGLQGVYQNHQKAATPIPAYKAYQGAAPHAGMSDQALRMRMDTMVDSDGQRLLRKTGRKYTNIPLYELTDAGVRFIKLHLGVDVRSLSVSEAPTTPRTRAVIQVAKGRQFVVRPSASADAGGVTRPKAVAEVSAPAKTAVAKESPLVVRKEGQAVPTPEKENGGLFDYDQLESRLDGLIAAHKEEAFSLREQAQVLLDKATAVDAKRKELESMLDRLFESRRQIEALQFQIEVL